MFINTYKDESASEDGTTGLRLHLRLGPHSAPPHSPQVEIMYRCVPVFSLIHLFLTDDDRISSVKCVPTHSETSHFGFPERSSAPNNPSPPENGGGVIHGQPACTRTSARFPELTLARFDAHAP